MPLGSSSSSGRSAKRLGAYSRVDFVGVQKLYDELQSQLFADQLYHETGLRAENALTTYGVVDHCSSKAAHVLFQRKTTTHLHSGMILPATVHEIEPGSCCASRYSFVYEIAGQVCCHLR